MSPLQQKPILHGRDHCPGGADPIPCMISGPSGDFEGVVLQTGPFAYWRLGETGEPWADTSGVAPASDLSEHETGTALSPDVTGALATGDDGALEFNYDGSDLVAGRYLTSSIADKDFDFSAASQEFTVAVWAKVKASAASRRGLIIGTATWSIPGSYRIGWGLQVIYPARTIRFTYGEPGGGAEVYAETAGGVTVGDWSLIIGTYDLTTLRLYMNAELVDSTAGVGEASADGKIFVGVGFDGDDSSTDATYFYGTADEAVVWDRVLSQAEIDALYTAGAAGAGAGEQVLLSDGAGGTYWGQAGGAAIEDEAIVDRHVATGADIDPLKLEHPGGTTTFLRGDGTWAAAGGSDPADDTLVWMPLADSDGTLVLDAGDNVIPTLIPI